MFLELLSHNGTLEPTAEETAEALDRAAIYRSGPDHLEIVVDGYINREMYDRLKQQIDAAPCAHYLTLMINSDGGECAPSIDLYILLRRHPAPIKVALLQSRCESAAVLIALAADLRIAQADTNILLHPTSYELHKGSVRWTAKDIEEKAAELRSIDDDFNTITSQRTGCDVAIIQRESETEQPSTLAWCLANGFVHEVQS
ncbi:ATP-dependent Clp protease proteolytic subunit [Phyllobacterium chamaecytisi]|uniref:ATP-dependent Clp protease proteolytic subunit n=1 Tax=Phyllobacterium chamaecytisi TaxID=2876082 RepID=UPI001CCD0EAB|nr:ATP-dependent Clp protease proteolytic subunit [Phyllobacterium sp. KW56]MBZ9603960.1 ATP-dependent Clp protease proteolytic subunit [Phyllobacterium sp. KW56]